MTLGTTVEARRASVSGGVSTSVPGRGRLSGAGDGVRCTAGRYTHDGRRGRRRLVVGGDESQSVQHVDTVMCSRRTSDVHEGDHRSTADRTTTTTTATTRPRITRRY